jgi:aspartyl-tRNA(Asn)/glutamyl-tRNA(Gln) amidotransferase subunit B
MQEGNFRCDANVSVKPKSVKELGTRVEIKNVNSFRFVEKAIDFEIARQIEVVRAGGRVVQETRTFDSARGVTISMRSKEEARDYRYFPDPDLVPISIPSSWIEDLRKTLPELPEQKRNRMVNEYGLSPYDAGVLTGSRSLAGYFEQVLEELMKSGMDSKSSAKPASNWISGELMRLLNEEGIEIEQSKLKPSHMADVVRLVINQVLSSTGAKQVIAIVWKSGESVQSVVDREGLQQVNNLSALDPIINKMIAAFPGQVAEYRSGKEKLLGFFVGQIMQETGGKANPALLGEVLKKKLTSM